MQTNNMILTRRMAIGANTIAVATGAFSVAELSCHHPTHVFPDLSDTPALLKIVLAAK